MQQSEPASDDGHEPLRPVVECRFQRIPVAISPAPLTTFPEFSSQKKSETSSFPSRWLFEFASSIKEAVTNELIVSSQAHKKEPAAIK